MSPLVWTLAPLAVTLLAIAWISWRSRPRGPGDPIDTVEQHARFRAALARQSRPADGQDVS
ncbi:MAG: hypothetical protein DLM59_03520 [Pseudonocardiales bacterium]|nr:MAG: hypothetical protein DLM59_03520 [Pseudonocardiales bacterium]